MYEYSINNVTTNEERHVYGYTFADACRRSKLNMNEWNVAYYEYVD